MVDMMTGAFLIEEGVISMTGSGWKSWSGSLSKIGLPNKLGSEIDGTTEKRGVPLDMPAFDFDLLLRDLDFGRIGGDGGEEKNGETRVAVEELAGGVSPDFVEAEVVAGWV
jgi:hypothetical protein